VCVPEKPKPDTSVSHAVLMIPGALGGRRRPSYLAPALSEIVSAGGPLQTRAAPHQRRGLARQVRREFAARSLDLCWYRDGAHGLERRMRK
jgi:hypothetical protein